MGRPGGRPLQILNSALCILHFFLHSTLLSLFVLIFRLLIIILNNI